MARYNNNYYGGGSAYDIIDEMLQQTRPKKWAGYDSRPKTVDQILRSRFRSNSLMDIYKRSPEQFDFKTLSANEKETLLATHYKIFKDAFDIGKLPNANLVRLFRKSPSRYLAHLDFDALSKALLEEIAQRRPSFYAKYNIPLHKLDGKGWSHLIKHDKGTYIPLLIENIPNMRNKTSLRALLEDRPYIIPFVTVEAAAESILTAKEWALLLGWDKVRTEHVSYQLEVCEWIKLETMVEVLAGSANSRKLQAAIKLMEKWA